LSSGLLAPLVRSIRTSMRMTSSGRRSTSLLLLWPVTSAASGSRHLQPRGAVLQLYLSVATLFATVRLQGCCACLKAPLSARRPQDQAPAGPRQTHAGSTALAAGDAACAGGGGAHARLQRLQRDLHMVDVLVQVAPPQPLQQRLGLAQRPLALHHLRRPNAVRVGLKPAAARACRQRALPCLRRWGRGRQATGRARSGSRPCVSIWRSSVSSSVTKSSGSSMRSLMRSSASASSIASTTISSMALAFLGARARQGPVCHTRRGACERICGEAEAGRAGAPHDHSCQCQLRSHHTTFYRVHAHVHDHHRGAGADFR